jgi:Tfp pilus assembly protein PilE
MMRAAAMTERGKKKMSGGVIALIVVGVAAGSCMCIGIGGAIAIPAFINYVKRSKLAEAESNVRVLAVSVENHCRTNGALPGSAGPLPTSVGPQKQSVDFESDETFRALGFGPRDPIYYSYAIEPTAAGLDAVARGDLDGDGIQSKVYVSCRPDCGCGTDLVYENELE